MQIERAYSLQKCNLLQMFDEKAEEVSAARERLTEATKRLREREAAVRDMQDREEELQVSARST